LFILFRQTFNFQSPEGAVFYKVSGIQIPRAWVGSLRPGSGPPSKIIRPAAPLPNYNNCLARLVLYFMNLPCLQILVLHTCDELLKRNRTAL